MEKICLVKAGDYLLGIDAANIIRKMDMESYINEDRKNEISPFHLTSFLDQQDIALPGPDSYVLEVKTSAEPLTLLVDRVLEEISVPDHFEPLPLLYPEFAKACCPQIVIHENQPVLLLDEGELDSVRARLKNDCGVISLDTLREKGAYDKTRARLEKDPALNDGMEKNNSRQIADFDESTFNKIVSWTIGQYLDRGGNENCVIHFGELLSEHVHFAGLQGVSDNLLQTLIDMTVRKCRIVDNTTLRRLRKKSGGMTT